MLPGWAPRVLHLPGSSAQAGGLQSAHFPPQVQHMMPHNVSRTASYDGGRRHASPRPPSQAPAQGPSVRHASPSPGPKVGYALMSESTPVTSRPQWREPPSASAHSARLANGIASPLPQRIASIPSLHTTPPMTSRPGLRPHGSVGSLPSCNPSAVNEAQISQHAAAQKFRQPTTQAPSSRERKQVSTDSSAVGGNLSAMQGSPGCPSTSGLMAGLSEIPCNRVDDLESFRDRKMDYIADKMGTLEEMMRQNNTKAANSEVKDRHPAEGLHDPHPGHHRALYAEERRHKEDMILRLQQEEQAHAQTRFERDEVQRKNEGMNQGIVSAKDDIARTERLYEQFMQELDSKKKDIFELNHDKDKLSRENNSLIRERADLQQRLQDEKEDKELQMRETAAELNSEKVRRQALEKQNDIVTKRHLESHSQSEQQFAQEVQAETKRADKVEKELRSAKTAQQQERHELQEKLREMREENRIARDALERSEAEKQDVAYQLDLAQKQVQDIRQSERRERTRQVEQLKLEEQSKVEEACSRVQLAQAELDGKQQELQQQAASVAESKQALEQHRKENKRLGGVVQDQKVLLWECESLMRQDRNAGKLMTPGEAARILKCRDDSFACENSRLHVNLATYEGLIEDIEQELREYKAENDHLKQVVNGRAGAR